MAFQKLLLVASLLCLSLSLRAQRWSPDGSKIAFCYIHAIEDIYVVNEDGSNFTIVDQDPERDFAVDWSPDGQVLAFTSIRDGHHEIYTRALSGDEAHRLTQTEFNSEDPSFSPDGKRIAFTSNRDGNNEIYVVDLDSKKLKRLTNTPHFKEVAAKWSPDGSKILFVGAEQDEKWDIWVMDKDGKNRSRVTNTPDYGEFHASWSSDAKKVAFIRVVDGTFELHTINIDGTDDRIVIKKEGYQVFFPNWSPDDQWIAFTLDIAEGTESGLPSLCKTDLRGNYQVITSENSFHLYSKEN